jgi:hypothetical protein
MSDWNIIGAFYVLPGEELFNMAAVVAAGSVLRKPPARYHQGIEFLL